MRPNAAAALLIWLCGASAFGLPPEVNQHAAEDWRQIADVAQRNRTRYLWISAPPEQLEAYGKALCFLVCSASREQNLDRQMPVAVRADLWRIDLGRLGWDVGEFNRIAVRHPYSPASPTGNPLTLHAGWFLDQLQDGAESDAYYRLLYGPKPPKNAAEFLAFWRVDQKRLLADGRELARQIAGQSGVSVSGTRTLFAYQTETGSLWETRDVLKLDAARDPIDNAGRETPFDGQEWILTVPKVSAARGERGVAQVYWLTDAKGARVETANNELVSDHAAALGTQTIHNPISCVVCHAVGLNPIVVNEYARIMRPIVGDSPERADYDEQTADRLERLLFPIGNLIERQNEDFAAFVGACGGLTPDLNVAAVRGVMDGYRLDVDRQTAAAEIGVSPEVFTLAIAEATRSLDQKGRQLNARLRLVAAANGDRIPRDLWEERYAAAVSYCNSWNRRP